MKKMILMALMSMVVSAVSAQVVNTESMLTVSGTYKMRPDSVTPNGEWQKVIETSLTAKEGFKYGKQVLARIVPNFQQRVKLQDEEDAKIVCEVPLNLLQFFKLRGTDVSVKGNYTMTMTWLFKDGRYKVSAEDVKCTYQLRQSFNVIDQSSNESFYLTNVKTGGEMLNNIKGESSRLLMMFSKALEKQKADDDF